jgi:phenylacetate-CoA ligase
MPTYWNPEIETLPPEKLEKLQLQGLQFTVAQALKTPFYKKRLAEAGLKSAEDIRSLSDLAKLPFTTKDDLRQGFPDAFLAVDKREVIRLHVSSGTTGMPTVVYHTRRDIDKWTELCARSIAAAGAGKSDVFQNTMTYGLFTGGLGLHYGAEAVGMLTIPAGAGNSRRQIQLMLDFHTTVIHATPSYLLHLYDEMIKEAVPLARISLKKAFIGAEPHSENIRKKIESLLHIDAYNSYGMSEMNGPGVAFECTEKNEMHLWEDAFLMEIIDPSSLQSLGEEAGGELVMTTLAREATPLIRYRTRDLTRIRADRCPCGRHHRRIERIKGRSDDMLIINGVNVFPSQIETVLMNLPEVGNNYLIQVEKQGALDKLIVKTEMGPSFFKDDKPAMDRLKEHIKAELRFALTISPAVEIHEPGFLPASQGKAVRVVDTRKNP